MRQVTPNARFWIWYGESFVKLTLKPGQSLMLTAGATTDEGGYYSETIYSHDGDCVTRASFQSSTDCDGRLDCEATDSAALDELSGWETCGDMSETVHGPCMCVPHWSHGRASQRDYNAEAAGY